MVSESELKNKVICVVGLGYVGFPLLEEFSKHFKVVGFDVNDKKVAKLADTYRDIEITSDASRIKICDYVIIAVPTPVTNSKQPDLAFIESAVEIIGKNLKKGAIVVLESTVYPGVTDEVIVPILEKTSGMKFGIDFKVGYSPERINPGDKNHTIDKITKIVSGSDEIAADELSELYGKITNVFKAKDIKTAEAAKVIENIQRDLNIALTNELSMIFHKMGLDTHAVLDAASTKWNFHRYDPGLVGGHCIPVDPYYLVYKARQLDYHPQVILAGRSVNDNMPNHVVNVTIKALNEAGKVISKSKVLLMGLTFKENVEDTRSSPSVNIIKELKEFKCDVYGYDPLLSLEEISKFGLTPLESLNIRDFDCIIFTVFHDEFKSIGLDDLNAMMKENPVLIDIRHNYNRKEAEEKGFYYRTL